MKGQRVVASALMGGILVAFAWGLAATSRAYEAIERSQAERTILLTGRDLGMEEVVAVARHGARVELDEAARQRSRSAYRLLLEGARQGVPIYWFNRAPGSGREETIFRGDPLAPENAPRLRERQLARFRGGARWGTGPEVGAEEIVRAMLVVRANTMVYEAASPPLTQMLLDLLNHDIAPVVQSRGSPGEGDLPMMANVAATMVGAGEAYHRGERMQAAEALKAAGLSPLEPFAADDAALISSNAFSAGQAVLLLDEARRLLDWSDLVFAMSMLGLNSSVTPLARPVQEARPFACQSGLARRLLGFVRGSYLLEREPGTPRIIQDPLSFRDYSQRQGALWAAYVRLREHVLLQINASDHNPAVVPGARPGDSWELDTPWLRQYHVEPGPNGPGGFILSSANFVAQPWANDLQAFSMALAESMAASVQRVLRLRDDFFTVVTPAELLPEEVRARAAHPGSSYAVSDLMAELQVLAYPVPAQGLALVRGVEDMQSFTRLRVVRARRAVEAAFRIVAEEMLSASYWMELRKAQDPARRFGEAPAAALEALRAEIPWRAGAEARPPRPPGEEVRAFLRETPAARFIGGSEAPEAWPERCSRGGSPSSVTPGPAS